MLAHSGHVMTLANSIIGVGILAMPFCFQKCGIVLSVVLLIVSNWITRICCHYLIKCSLLTRRKSYEFLGFHAFGRSGKLLVELCIIGYLLGTCITYFVVVGDLGPQIITKMFSLDGGPMHLRTWIMLAVTLVCILPLGMLKNVDSLSTVCTASIGFYVCLVVKIVLESEEHIVSNDWMQKVVYWEPAGVLQCLPIFSMALSCQMQLFEVFESINNQSLEKLNGIVRNATWICTFVYIAVGFFGYVAFCTQDFAGNILMNLSPSFGSDVIKIGFILSVAFSFPLVIFPCRASIYSLLYRKGHTDATGYIPGARFKGITVFIVCFALCIALMIPSVELIIGLVGSTIGVAICIMFPASCFRKIVRKESTERMLAQFILVAGFCLMILGTYANLNAIDAKSSGAHLAVPQLEKQEQLLAPTELPLLPKQDKLDLLEQKLKETEADFKKDAQAQENAAKLPKEPEQVLDKNVQPVGKMLSPPGPPLPVDEQHNEDHLAAAALEVKPKVESIAQMPDKLRVISPMPEVVKIVALELNKTEHLAAVDVQPLKAAAEKIIPQPELPPPNDKVKDNLVDKLQKPTQQQQTIDKDAIKKDEEIAAEESNKESKANAAELKETRKELKKTQELLERTVDELREELAKQNKETQNLVVEKLGEVVEKVEEIERKVHQKEVQPPTDETGKVLAVAGEAGAAAASAAVPAEPPAQLAAAAEPQVKLAEPQVKLAEPQDKLAAAEPQPLNKGSLLSVLANNTNVIMEPKGPPPPGEVYEPLSYKTGELIEHARSGSRLEQRLPLPLALLINSSHTKMQENMAEEQPAPKDKSAPAADNAKQKQSPYLLKSEVKRDLHSPDQAVAIKSNRLAEKLTSKQQPAHVPAQQLEQSETLLTPSTMALAQRLKRASGLDTPNLRAVEMELQHENCLHEPKVEMLMAHGLSNALEFKMRGIAYDLKPLKEEERK